MPKPHLTNAEIRAKLTEAGFSVRSSCKTRYGGRDLVIGVPAAMNSYAGQSRRELTKLENAIRRQIHSLLYTRGPVDDCELFHTDDAANPIDGYVSLHVPCLD